MFYITQGWLFTKECCEQKNYVIVIIFLPDGDAHVLVRANLH